MPTFVLDSFLAAIFDDSAMLAPGSMAAPDPLEAHRRLRASSHADLVGPLLVPASRLAALLPLARSGEDLRIAVVADDGLAGLVEALGLLTDYEDRLTASHAEIALPTGFPSEQSAAALIDQLALSITTYFVVPRTGFAGALDVLAADGAERAAYQASEASRAELADFVQASTSRSVAFKIIDGLDHALSSSVGHGFLNVLVATAAALDGASTDHLIGLLGESSMDGLLPTLAGASPAEVRRSLVSCGCPNVSDLLAELDSLRS